MTDEKETPTKKVPEQEPKKKRVPQATVPVTLIAASGKASLVEYQMGGKLARSFIPSGKIKNLRAPKPVLMAGSPYGVEWEGLSEVFPGIDTGQLAVELRSRGIWTHQDTMSYPAQVNAAIMRTANLVRATITEFARESEKE